MGDISIKGRSPILRQGYAVGGAVKAGKRFFDFIKTGKHVDKHGVKVNVPKAAERLTGKPHVDHGKRKRIKHLGKGKAEGGRIGFRTGSRRGPSAGERIKARKARADEWWTGKRGNQRTYVPGLDKELREKRPHSSPEGRMRDIKAAFAKNKADKIQGDLSRYQRTVPSGRALHKKGGKADKRWIQKATASIKKRGTKGKCTPITKPGCTGRAKALAKTFKKMAKKRKTA